MNEKAFIALIQRIKSSSHELDLSKKLEPYYSHSGNHYSENSDNLMGLTKEQARQFKEAMIEVGPRILKLNISNHDLSNLGAMRTKRRLTGGSYPSDDVIMQIMKDVFDGIASCCNLHELRMACCEIDDFCLAPNDFQNILGKTLEKMPQLRVLDLSSNRMYCHRGQLTTSLFAAIAASNIEELNLTGCCIAQHDTDQRYGQPIKPVRDLIADIFANLAKMRKLKRVSLSGNYFSYMKTNEWEFLTRSLASIATLQDIDLQGNGLSQYLNEDAIPEGVKLFLNGMQHKYVTHDLSCATDMESVRQLIRANNLRSAIDVVYRVKQSHTDFVNVRFEVFQAQYFEMRSAGRPARDAFRHALKLIIHEGNILKLDEQQTQVFDSFLCQYFDKNLSPGITLSPDERIEFLNQAQLDSQDLKINIERYTKLHEFLTIAPLKLCAASKEISFLIYIEEVNRWYIAGYNVHNLPVIGFVDDFRKLGPLQDKLQNTAFTEIDTAICVSHFREFYGYPIKTEVGRRNSRSRSTEFFKDAASQSENRNQSAVVDKLTM